MTLALWGLPSGNSMVARHTGHWGAALFRSIQRYTQFQQNRCPQTVTTGCSGTSRQMRQVNFASEGAGGGGDAAGGALPSTGTEEGRTSSTILILGRRCRKPEFDEAESWSEARPGTNEYELLNRLGESDIAQLLDATVSCFAISHAVSCHCLLKCRMHWPWSNASRAEYSHAWQRCALSPTHDCSRAMTATTTAPTCNARRNGATESGNLAAAAERSSKELEGRRPLRYCYYSLQTGFCFVSSTWGAADDAFSIH
jgi:hypothetical protein